ncbi:MAG: SufD family Fe-S cluster assembly protein [Bacilli bacterium]|nr:SufD family Fe-S cluster assembly protein [Bacilli bacterium]
MNKIRITNDVIELIDGDGKIDIKATDTDKFLNVKTIDIKINEDTNLAFEILNTEYKYDIYFNVLKGVHSNIYEIKKGDNYKFQYKYYLEEDSFLNVEKVNDGMVINEMNLINLNGARAKIDFNLKTISKKQEKYNFLVYHNAKKTVSNIVNNGVNISDGTLEFNVSGFVPNGIVDCDVSQSGRIINMTNNTCVIKPNLFIDENDVVANHSALIGTFSFDEIFYLMSRGIDKKEALNLLTQGFLLKNITFYKEDLKEMIDKYWR